MGLSDSVLVGPRMCLLLAACFLDICLSDSPPLGLLPLGLSASRTPASWPLTSWTPASFGSRVFGSWSSSCGSLGRGSSVVGRWVVGLRSWVSGVQGGWVMGHLHLGKSRTAGDRHDRLLVFKKNPQFASLIKIEDGRGGHLKKRFSLSTRPKVLPCSGLLER